MNKLRQRLLQQLPWWFLALAAADTLWAIGWTLTILLSVGDHAGGIRRDPVVWGIVALLYIAAVLNRIAWRRCRDLRGYWFLLVVTLCNLVPAIHIFYLGGVPVAVIGLLTLFNRPVRDVFRAVAAGVPRDEALARLITPPRFTAADEMDTANDDWDQAQDPGDRRSDT